MDERFYVFQPNLNQKSSLVARAVALADLGTAGLESSKRYFQDAIALFHEDNIDFEDLVKQAGANHKDNLTTRMRNYLNFQKDFISTRKDSLKQELDGLNDQQKQAVTSLFHNFDSAAEEIEKLGKINEISYDRLLELFSYKST